MITRSQARGIIRKAVKRVPEGEEVRHLNIIPMLDIMTVLLIAFVFSANEDALLAIGDVQMAESRTMDPKPEQATTLTIARNAILVDGRPVVEVKNGDVDASEKKDGALGIQIPRLSRFLGAIRKEYEEEARAAGRETPPPELFIIADKSTPYKLLFQVMASSRAEEAGYRQFRLIVLEAGSAQPADF
jgi:biopolymer transport protein ExbD